MASAGDSIAVVRRKYAECSVDQQTASIAQEIGNVHREGKKSGGQPRKERSSSNFEFDPSRPRLPLGQSKRQHSILEFRFDRIRVDLVAEHRDVAALLTVDPAVSAHLPPDLQLQDRALRFVAITVEGTDHPLAATRSLAALGSVARPLAASGDLADFDDPATRRLLVDCALAVLRTPMPVSPGGAPTGGPAGS
jgi:hypothetical protein